MPAKLNIAQIEYVRSGTKGYKPQNAAPFIDLTIAATDALDNAYSDHATAVANLWQDHGTLALINTWFVCEALNFTLKPSLNAGYTMVPLPARWHLAILPFGFTSTWTLDACTKFAFQCERDNVLALISPADNDGSGAVYQFPCNVSSANVLRVASSTTGSTFNSLSTPEIYFPVDWNSYVQPSMVAAGIAQILDWLLQGGYAYKASDIKTIILATAQPDAQGRKIFNGSAALAAVKAKYGAPVVQPPPPPPPPTPDQLCAQIAAALGLTYANGSFSGVTATLAAKLLDALKSAGLE